MKARFINVGQSCINAKRFNRRESVADRFADAFCAGVAALKVGDPLERDDTAIGPMARGNLRETLHDQVERSVKAGAVLRAGGAPLNGPGFFYPPTVRTMSGPDMAAACEETFGRSRHCAREGRRRGHCPRQCHGIRPRRRVSGAPTFPAPSALARRIEAGAVFINGMTASDPRLPFGGIKKFRLWAGTRNLRHQGIREYQDGVDRTRPSVKETIMTDARP